MPEIWNIGVDEEEMEEWRLRQRKEGLSLKDLEEDYDLFQAIYESQASRVPTVDYFGRLIDALLDNDRYRVLNEEDGPIWWIIILRCAGKLPKDLDPKCEDAKRLREEGVKIYGRLLRLLLSRERRYVRSAIKGVEMRLEVNLGLTNAIEFIPGRAEVESSKKKIRVSFDKRKITLAV